MTQVLARKWRPSRFADVVGQTHVVQALSNALNQNYLHHAYLFTGTRGVGKTTLARILAKCLNCEQGISANPCETCAHCTAINQGRFPDLFEVDAASRTKVEDTRELLENVQYAPAAGRFKVYLIDEVHMLSGHSFNALLKTLEEPPEHVKFLLATTDPQKLPATVLSRCLQFHLLLLTPEQIADHLAHVLTEEKIDFEQTALMLIGKAANGSMRDALSLLDQGIAFGNGRVFTDDIKQMLGHIEPTALYDILTALHQQNANGVFDAIAKLNEQGVDFSAALAELLSMLHNIAILQAIPDIQRDSATEALKQLAQAMSNEDTQLFYQIGLIGQRDLPLAPTPQVGFEMILLRMLAFIPASDTGTPTHRKPTRKPAQQPAAATKATQTASPTQPNTDWNSLLSSLTLTGPTKALAQQCSMKALTENVINLSLDPKHRALLNPRQVQRLEEALEQQLNQPMKVKIDIEISNVETPAGIAEQQRQNRQQSAEQSIQTDDSVQQLMQTFDASIVSGSVAPLEH